MMKEMYEEEMKQLLFFLYDYLGNAENTVIDLDEIYSESSVNISDVVKLRYVLEHLNVDKYISVKYCDDEELCYELTKKGRTLVEDYRYSEEVARREAEERARREAEEAEKRRVEEEERARREAEEAERRRKEEEERKRREEEEAERKRKEEEERRQKERLMEEERQRRIEEERRQKEEKRRQAIAVQQRIEQENEKLLQGKVSKTLQKEVAEKVNELKRDENYREYLQELSTDALSNDGLVEVPVKQESELEVATPKEPSPQYFHRVHEQDKKQLLKYTFMGAFAGAGLGIVLMSLLWLILYVCLK